MDALRIGDVAFFGKLSESSVTHEDYKGCHSVGVIVDKALFDDVNYKLAIEREGGFVYKWFHTSELKQSDCYRLVKKPNNLSNKSIKRVVARNVGRDRSHIKLLLYNVSFKLLFRRYVSQLFNSNNLTNVFIDLGVDFSSSEKQLVSVELYKSSKFRRLSLK